MSRSLSWSDYLIVTAAFVGLGLVGHWLGWLHAAPPLFAPGILP